MKKKFIALSLAATVLGHSVFANIDASKKYFKDQAAKVISTKPDQKKKSDTLYMGGKETAGKDIVNIHFDDILQTFGQKEGMEIIRKHFVQEINTLRVGLNPLKGDKQLAICAQKHAEFLANNAELYDFTGKDQTRSPHMEYDATGTNVVNTVGKRAKDAGCFYTLIRENISTIGYLRPNDKGNINEVLQEWLAHDGHEKNLRSLTENIGVGYYNGIVVILFSR